MRLKFTRTERRALYLGVGLTFLVMLARLLNVGENMALGSLDILFELRGPVQPSTPIVIVGMDEESFNEMGPYPWPRNVHAKMIRNLMKGGPKAIVFDVLFTEPAPESRWDEQLASACRASGCVILGSELVQVMDKNYQYEELKVPIKPLLNAILSDGVVNTPRDPDSFVRHAQFIWKLHDERHYSLATEAMRRYLQVGKGEINKEGGILEFGERRIPIDEEDKMMINFSGPAKTFKTVPYYQVYKGLVNPSEFKDAIVFVGATAETLHDTFPAPFVGKSLFRVREEPQMPGVEVHANAIETVVTQRFITPLGGGWRFLLLMGAGILVSLVAIRARIWVALLTSLGLTVLVFALSAWLFVSHRIFLEYVHPAFAVWLAFLGATVYRASIEAREKQRVRATFARYVSPHVLTTVLTRPPELGGQRRLATILFSDVRGFTSMSEKLTAHEVVEILNEYLTEMVSVVLEHDGTLDKFVGDAVMAVYGSPLDQHDHAIRAVSTAWEMSRRHEALKVKWVAEGKVPFEIGIGLNTGEVVAGNMGSPQRMEFTVIGDNVNLASRMESATKDVGQKILMSESTYELVKDHVKVLEHDPIKMKGKAQAIKVYSLQGVDEAVAAKLQKPVKTAPIGKARS